MATNDDDQTNLDVSALSQDPNNARQHTPRNLEMIADALQEVGPARSIVIDEHATILAGNATVLAAARVGIHKVRVVDVDDDTLIAVRRRGLTPAQKVKLSLYDNRTAELASWDAEMLLRLRDLAFFDTAEFWNDAEFRELQRTLEVVNDGLTDPEAIPPLRTTSIAPGDLFELGTHRLICGDSTEADVVRRVLAGDVPFLMVTDPPYGVEYDPTWRARAGLSASGRVGKVANDDQADWSAAWRLFPGDVAYVWHAGLFASVVEHSLRSVHFEPRAQIIWSKQRFVLSRGHYHWQHEPCWYAVRRGSSARWGGSRKEATVWHVAGALQCGACGATMADAKTLPTTVWEIPTKDDTGETTHGTQKPVECMARPMRNHGVPGDAVYEPFNGSGSSLIAAEQVGRRLRAIELTPSYVQQAIDRWEQFTGKQAVKAGGR